MNSLLEKILQDLTSGDDERAERAVAQIVAAQAATIQSTTARSTTARSATARSTTARSATARSAALFAFMMPELLDALRGMFGGDEETRWWAARALAEIKHPSVPGLLVDMLADEEGAVRQCAALGLRLHPHREAVPALIKALEDGDRLFAGLAADALEQIGEAAVMPLLEVLENGSQPARLAAVRALAKIGDPRAIPALFAALDDDSSIVEHWANEGLERMGVGMLFFEP